MRALINRYALPGGGRTTCDVTGRRWTGWPTAPPGGLPVAFVAVMDGAATARPVTTAAGSANRTASWVIRAHAKTASAAGRDR